MIFITLDLVSLNFKFHLSANFDLMSNSVLSSCSELAIQVISSAKSSELINWFETWTPTPALSRTLKSNYHVQTYVKDNMDNKINVMSRILAEHGNFNRVEFGNCMLLNKSSFTLEDVSQAPQQCEIEGRRTEFHNASPNSTRLKLPCLARIRDMT
jgi:hypothetical protein